MHYYIAGLQKEELASAFALKISKNVFQIGILYVIMYLYSYIYIIYGGVTLEIGAPRKKIPPSGGIKEVSPWAAG